MMPFDFCYSPILPLPVNLAEDTDHADSAADYGITDTNGGHSGSFNMQRDYAWASALQQVNLILNHVRKLQQKFDDIAQEMHALMRSLDLLRQGALEDTTVDPPSPDVIAQEMQATNRSSDLLRQGTIDDTRMDGSKYPPWPTDMTPGYTTTNCAGPPISNALYAGYSHLPSAEDNAPSLASQSTISSDVDIPAAMNSVTCFYRNGTKRYRCQCGSETERIGDMKRHLKSGNHLSPQFACFCGRRFTRKDGRKTHQKKYHKMEAPDAFST
jgi:hypothetical protein